MTTTAPVREVGTLVHVRPRDLAIASNVRDTVDEPATVIATGEEGEPLADDEPMVDFPEQDGDEDRIRRLDGSTDQTITVDDVVVAIVDHQDLAAAPAAADQPDSDEIV